MSNVPERAEALSALRQLLAFIDTWHVKAINQGTLPPLDEASKILIWVRTIDFFLTRTPRAESSYLEDTKASKAFLEGEPWVVYLSDGGYSRLILDLLDGKLGIDRSLSLPSVLVRWADLASARR